MSEKMEKTTTILNNGYQPKYDYISTTPDTGSSLTKINGGSAYIGIDYSNCPDMVSVSRALGYDESQYMPITGQNLTRWLVGQRSYFYVFRKKIDNVWVNYFKRSKLLDELLGIYDKEKPNTYVEKKTKKAE